MRRVREGQNQVEPVFSRSQAIAVADQHPHLNRAQKSVIEDVLSSRTECRASRATRAPAKQRRSRSFAARPEARDTRSKALRRLHAPPASSPKRALKPERCRDSWRAVLNARRPEQKHFYFVDESSLASTNQMREFLHGSDRRPRAS